MLPNDVHRASLPTTPGVYFFKLKGGKNLYIGKAKNLHKRLQQYFTPKSLRKQDMVAKAHHIEWIPASSEEEAIILETQLIKEHKPMYNNLIKGDNAYVYLKIPHEDYPNILLSRYKKNDKAVYIGPKVWHRQLKNTLHIMRSVLKYRSCSASTFKKGSVCSDYFFGLCAGRCAYASSTDPLKEKNNIHIGFERIYSKEEAKERYRQLLDTIIAFFNGDSSPLELIIQQDIEEAVSQQHFERAAKLRDVYLSITTMSQQTDVALDSLNSGIFVHIRPTGSWIIYVVTKIKDGKIIDIITGKESQEESSIEDIFHMIEQEYICTIQQDKIGENFWTGYSFIKKLRKKDVLFLQERCDLYLSSYLQSHHEQSTAVTNEMLKTLETRYHLRSLPYLIECVDISHFGGEHTVGAVTRMQAGRIDKSGYRRYRIQSTSAGDDYKAMEEVITRRFTKQPWPDLFVLDGGKGQMNIITKITEQKNIPKWNDILDHTTFIALGKGKARSRKGKNKGEQEYISYFDKDQHIQQIPLTYDAIDRLLVLLRDEAHRFSNAYRKKRMSGDFS